MAGEKVCIYHKFGYCKLMGDCKFLHTEEVCQDSMCGIRNCNKRHPSTCKFYLHYGVCKFGTSCKYDHNMIDKKIEVQERMKSLEEMCAALKTRCDQVNQECKELRENIEKKTKEVADTAKECLGL